MDLLTAAFRCEAVVVYRYLIHRCRARSGAFGCLEPFRALSRGPPARRETPDHAVNKMPVTAV
eukprot:6212145-Alexandrium_andersonii.AAC.1